MSHIISLGCLFDNCEGPIRARGAPGHSIWAVLPSGNFVGRVTHMMLTLKYNGLTHILLFNKTPGGSFYQKLSYESYVLLLDYIWIQSYSIVSTNFEWINHSMTSVSNSRTFSSSPLLLFSTHPTNTTQNITQAVVRGILPIYLPLLK